MYVCGLSRSYKKSVPAFGFAHQIIFAAPCLPTIRARYLGRENAIPVFSQKRNLYMEFILRVDKQFMVILKKTSKTIKEGATSAMVKYCSQVLFKHFIVRYRSM